MITPVNFAFESTIRNELLTVAPFTAFAITLNEDWFTQGFGQLDVPLTPLVGSINSQLSVPDFGFNPSPVSESGNIEIQKIMRLSLGVGRYLYRANGRQLALMSELHYTTTIEDAKLSEVQVIDAIPPLLPETTVQIGNIANRTDVLDIVIGLPVSIGQWRFINGVVAPLRPAPDRGFSWEYNSMIGKQF